jgi:hypothetical protein
VKTVFADLEFDDPIPSLFTKQLCRITYFGLFCVSLEV